MSNEVFISINGKKLTGFTSLNLQRSIETFCGQFSITTTILEDNQEIKNELKLQSEVSILIDDNIFLTGNIESLQTSYNAQQHTITVAGRDKTGDLVDSSIIQKEYKERNLVRLIKKVLSDNGFSDIGVKTDTIATLPSGEVVKTEPNESIFAFLNRYAERAQVLLLTDTDGSILVTTEGNTRTIGALINYTGDENNNIKSGNLNLGTEDRFRFVDVYSQSTGGGFGASVKQKGSAVDSEILRPRRKIITAGKASQKALLDNIAEWNVIVKRAKGLRYNCEVAGYYSDKESTDLWRINRVVSILDDKCEISGDYLIQGITFNKDLSSGTTTTLDIVEIGAFSIDPTIKFIKSTGALVTGSFKKWLES